MTEFRKIVTAADLVERDAVRFGLVDAKGREWGYQWRIERLTLRDKTPEDGWCYVFPVDASVMFRVNTHLTRDGKPYGASINTIDEPTLDAAKAALARRVAAARKRKAR